MLVVLPWSLGQLQVAGMNGVSYATLAPTLMFSGFVSTLVWSQRKALSRTSSQVTLMLAGIFCWVQVGPVLFARVCYLVPTHDSWKGAHIPLLRLCMRFAPVVPSRQQLTWRSPVHIRRICGKLMVGCTLSLLGHITLDLTFENPGTSTLPSACSWSHKDSFSRLELLRTLPPLLKLVPSRLSFSMH